MRPKSPLLVLLLAPFFLVGCGQDLPTAGEHAALAVNGADGPSGGGRFFAGPSFPDQNLNGFVCIKGGERDGEPVPESQGGGEGGGGGPIVIIDDVGGTCPPAFERTEIGRRGVILFFEMADADRDGLVCVKGPNRREEPSPEAMEEPSLPRGAIVVIDDVNDRCPPPFEPVWLFIKGPL